MFTKVGERCGALIGPGPHKYPGTYLCMLCVGEKSIYDLFCHNFGRRRQQLYREHQFKNEPIEQENESRMKQRTTHSVWPDGQIVYSTVEHLEPLKFAQLHVNLPKYRSTLCQILNSKFSRNGLRFLWLYQSGKIFPNPVTLLMHSFIQSYLYCNKNNWKIKWCEAIFGRQTCLRRSHFRPITRSHFRPTSRYPPVQARWIKISNNNRYSIPTVIFTTQLDAFSQNVRDKNQNCTTTNRNWLRGDKFELKCYQQSAPNVVGPGLTEKKSFFISTKHPHIPPFKTTTSFNYQYETSKNWPKILMANPTLQSIRYRPKGIITN